MLYHLLYALHGQLSLLNVTRYITFRTAVASLTALFLVLILGPWTIERLRRLQVGQYIREEGPQAHQAKAGTPTMGGVLILVGIFTPTLLWADLTNRNVWILVLSTLAYGAVGFADDYVKVVKKRNLGLTARSAANRRGFTDLIGRVTLVGAESRLGCVCGPPDSTTTNLRPPSSPQRSARCPGVASSLWQRHRGGKSKSVYVP